MFKREEERHGRWLERAGEKGEKEERKEREERKEKKKERCVIYIFDAGSRAQAHASQILRNINAVCIPDVQGSLGCAGQYCESFTRILMQKKMTPVHLARCSKTVIARSAPLSAGVQFTHRTSSLLASSDAVHNNVYNVLDDINMVQ